MCESTSRFGAFNKFFEISFSPSVVTFPPCRAQLSDAVTPSTYIISNIKID